MLTILHLLYCCNHLTPTCVHKFGNQGKYEIFWWDATNRTRFAKNRQFVSNTCGFNFIYASNNFLEFANIASLDNSLGQNDYPDGTLLQQLNSTKLC